MIRKVQIENYKSIPSLSLNLGRVTILIGANGSGKSNILEAIALASAAAQNKLDNEFLISRGIRETDTRFMRSAFRELPTTAKETDIAFQTDDEPKVQTLDARWESIRLAVEGEPTVAFDCELFPDETVSYPKWQLRGPLRFTEIFRALTAQGPDKQATHGAYERLIKELMDGLANRSAGTLVDFLVYCPDNPALRTFQSEGQILPLGIRGEGLFSHLKRWTPRRTNHDYSRSPSA